MSCDHKIDPVSFRCRSCGQSEWQLMGGRPLTWGDIRRALGLKSWDSLHG